MWSEAHEGQEPGSKVGIRNTCGHKQFYEGTTGQEATHAQHVRWSLAVLQGYQEHEATHAQHVRWSLAVLKGYQGQEANACRTC